MFELNTNWMNSITFSNSIESFGHFFSNRRIHWSHIPSRAPHSGKPQSRQPALICTSTCYSRSNVRQICYHISRSRNHRALCPLLSQAVDGLDVFSPLHICLWDMLSNIFLNHPLQSSSSSNNEITVRRTQQISGSVVQKSIIVTKWGESLR